MENKLVRSVLLKRNRGTLLGVAGIIVLMYLLALIGNLNNNFIRHEGLSVGLIGGSGDPAIFLFIIAVVLGIVVFLVDGQTRFNEFLFAMPVRKAVIFWQKVLMFWSTLVLSTIIGMLLYYGCLLTILPHGTVHGSLGIIFWNSVSQISMISFVFALSMFAGLIIGRPVLAFFTVTGFWIGFVFFWEGINYIAAVVVATLKHKKVSTDYTDILLAHIKPETFTGALTLVALTAIIVGFFLWWAQSLFKRLSLENNGRFLLFPEYRMILLVVFVIFMAIAVGFSTLIAVPLSMVGAYSESISPVKRSIVVLLTLIVSWFFGRWVIYRPDHIKDVFGLKRLD